MWVTGDVLYRPSTDQIVLTNLQVVPEPGTAGVIVAAAGLGLLARRRRRKA